MKSTCVVRLAALTSTNRGAPATHGELLYSENRELRVADLPLATCYFHFIGAGCHLGAACY